MIVSGSPELCCLLLPPIPEVGSGMWLHSSSHTTLGAGRLVGRLQHYSVLYVLSTPQITGACGRAIAAWVASGGILVSTGGGGLLDGAPCLSTGADHLFCSCWTVHLSGDLSRSPTLKPA